MGIRACLHRRRSCCHFDEADLTDFCNWTGFLFFTELLKEEPWLSRISRIAIGQLRVQETLNAKMSFIWSHPASTILTDILEKNLSTMSDGALVDSLAWLRTIGYGPQHDSYNAYTEELDRRIPSLSLRDVMVVAPTVLLHALDFDEHVPVSGIGSSKTLGSRLVLRLESLSRQLKDPDAFLQFCTAYSVLNSTPMRHLVTGLGLKVFPTICVSILLAIRRCQQVSFCTLYFRIPQQLGRKSVPQSDAFSKVHVFTHARSSERAWISR